MSDVLETIAISIDGVPWSYWSEFEGIESAEDAVRECSFVAHVPDNNQGISPDWVGKPATVYFGADLWLTGKVRDFIPGHGGKDRPKHEIDITLVSKTVDGTESSIDDDTGEARKVTLGQLGNRFDKLGIGWVDKTKSRIEPVERVISGESQWAVVQRRAASQGAFIHDDENGQFVITDKPEGRHGGTIGAGINIDHNHRVEARFTEAGRHDEVIVRGQSTIGTTEAALHSEAVVKDEGVKNKRPRILELEGESTPERLRKRAETEAKRAAGNGTTATIPIVGFRDKNGERFHSNWTIDVSDPGTWLYGEMVIKQINFIQATAGDPAGTNSILELADPRSLGGDDPKSESSAAYAAPTKPAEIRMRK